MNAGHRRSKIRCDGAEFASAVALGWSYAFGHWITHRLIMGHGHNVFSRRTVTREDNRDLDEGRRQGNRLQRGRWISPIGASIGQIQSSGNNRNVRRLLDLG